MLKRRLMRQRIGALKINSGNSEVIGLISKFANVADMVLFADKSGVQGNLLFVGKINGTDCFVKYSSSCCASIRQAYEMGNRFNAILPNHTPEMFKFVSLDGLGAACVMERYSGCALSEYLSRRKIDRKEADDLAMQLSRMLAEFHRHGIAHRDFGSYNIIRCDDGTLKAVDFQNSIGLEGHDTLADICLSRKSLYFLYSNIGYGCGTFNDYALLRRGLPKQLLEALDQTIGEDVSHFDFHCPLPFKVIFHCLWNLPACMVRSWFLRENSDAKKKATEKITAIKRTMREAVARIRREGVAKGVRNKRRYVNYDIIAENKKG
jgi:hypothetical protein